MNEIIPITNSSTQISTTKTTLPKDVSFKATKKAQQLDSYDTFIKEQEKARKNAKKQQNLSMGIQIGVLGALLASVGMMGWMYFGKSTPKLNFAQISEKMPSLNDDCINPKVKNFIQSTIEILKAPKEYLKYTGAEAPRMVLFHGPTGTGKTFSAKLMAKEMGANYTEIQFSDLSSEYVGKTAVNISRTFKDIAQTAKKNPDKQYVVTFNEIDSLINNVNKLGANNQHLGQNRTSFLNGLDSIKDIQNLTIIGTTNINPKTANLDAATLGRLGNIFEIENPIANEIKSAMKFHLEKSPAAKNLMNNEKDLNEIAELIYQHQGSQRDVNNIIKTALTDFTVKNLNNPQKETVQMSKDYILKAINNKETWASSLDKNATIEGASNNDIMQLLLKLLSQNKK